ncbi:MAG: InlB B-repeat-containing protein [Bacillota bacterium]
MKADPDAAKAAFLAVLEEKVAEIDVADVEIVGENITVSFYKNAAPADVLTAAEGLLAAFQEELEDATLIFNNDEDEGKFELKDENVAIDIAVYLLGEMNPADFLAGEETVEATYTAEATDKNDVTFTLAGTLKFQVKADPDAAKAAFLAALEEKVAEIDVADVEIVGENITVSFYKNAAPADVLTAAEGLLAAFQEELEDATLIFNNDEDEGKFELKDENVAIDIAVYLLGEMNPADFLAGEETVEATYTAEATDKNDVTFTLAGTLKFQVKADPDAAKAAFLAVLEEKVAEIDVADVEIVGENITVSFYKNAAPADVLTAAEGLLAAFQEELEDATLIFNNDEDEGKFELKDENVAIDIAVYLLGEMNPADFLAGEETVEATYTAEATDKNDVTFTLAGTLKFQVKEAEEEIPEVLDIHENTTLDQDYDTVNIVGNSIEVDLGGHTARVLTITGSNVTLKNGTVINLTIVAGTENVTLENITDGEGGTHTFAGGGGSSIVFKGNTLLKGIVNITAPEPIQIRSQDLNSGKGISGKVIVKTIKPVVIDIPVQGEVEVQVASESITIKKEVAKIVALTNTVIKIDQSIQEDKRPILQKAKGVEASAVIIDKDGEETGEEVSFEEIEDLTPVEAVIIHIENIEAEVEVGVVFSHSTTVKAVMSDGTRRDVPVVWDPPTADTSKEGTLVFYGTVEDYDGRVTLTLTVKAMAEKNNDATLSNLTIDGTTVEGFAADIFSYTIKLPAGAAEVPTVTATATDSKATVEITQATALDGTNNVATVKVTAEDGITVKTYTVTFTLAENQDQDPPKGLKGVAPTSLANDDGKITGVTDAMEYKLSTADEWIPVPEGATEITGLAAGTYYVRYAAKTGYNASEAVEVIVPEYVVPEHTVTFSVTGGNGTLSAVVDDAAITSGEKVEQGKSVVFTAEPGEGYQVKGWTVNGKVVEGNKTNVLTIPTVTADMTIAVEFEEIVSATINPTTGTFEQNEPEPADVITTITWNSATSIIAVKKGEVVLQENQDYALDGNILTIKKEYLAQQPLEDITLTIVFDKGEPATLTITISCTTPDEVIALINNLPPVEELALGDKEQVVKARQAYEDLTDNQKNLVSEDILAKLEAVESKMIQLEQELFTKLTNLKTAADERKRPGYTLSISEWDNYWGSFVTAKNKADTVYSNLNGKQTLTLDENRQLVTAVQELQRAIEILDGIEDFDEALGDREHPRGLVETVYERSLISDGFQPGRLRCYYVKETGDFYWMLSGFLQGQDLYSGTTGTGMNPGLQNVMLSDSIIRLESGEHKVEIYKEDGTRKTKTELENEGIKLALHWLSVNNISSWFYSGLVGLEEDCRLVGKTSDGTEFVRTYRFYFVDAGIELFDPNFRYCVVNGIVQRDLTGYNMLTYTAGENGTITGETTQTVKHGEDGTAVTAVPEEGYHFVKWSDGLTDNPRTDTNVTEDITVEALFAINEYTVTFVDHDGTEIKKETVEHGSSATAPAAPERAGYTFTGWDIDFTNVTENLTIKAQYEKAEYTLTIEYQYADGSIAAKSHTAGLNVGNAYEVVSPEITGYTPDKEIVSGTMPYEDVTITVIYTINKYTVVFLDHDGTELKRETVEHGSSATAPEVPARAGYTFTGWDVTFDNVTSDLTVKATYSINTYTVIFNVGGGSEVAVQTVEHGGKATEPEAPIKEGYTFAGWYADEEFTTAFNFDTAITADTTVYAKWEINTYTLTYTAGENGRIEGETTQIVEHGSNGSQVEAVPNAGYHFVKWSDGLTDNPRTDTNVTSNISVTAEFAINTYTVTFVDHDGTELKRETVEHGSSATAPEVSARAGYTFTGWDIDFTNVTGDLTVRATYSINTYTVTFNVGGGSEVAVQTVEHGGKATEPEAPIKEGYTFAGWYADEGFTTAFNFDAEITADTTIYAKWELNTYTVTYSAGENGTITGETTQTVKHGENGTAVTAVPNEGYHFVKWSDGLTDNPRTDTNVTSNISVTAEFAINTYTVTFIDWNEEVIDTQTVAHGSSATAPAEPTREGYTFTGWDIDFTNVTGDLTVTAQYEMAEYTLTIEYQYADGSIAAKSHTAGLNAGNAYEVVSPEITGYTPDKEIVSGTMPYEDVTITVIYTINTYTVTFVDWDGEVIDTQTVEHGKGATAPEEPTREGYTFTGWDTDFENVTRDLTVTATYSINTYTVTFDACGGSKVESQTVNYRETATEPEPPTKEGYTFAGWYADENLTILFDFATQITADTTVYAKWELNTYTLTYTAGENGTITGETTQTVKHGEDGSQVEAVPNAGYHFVKWSDGSTENPRIDTNVTEDITVTAEFAINTYTVTFIDWNEEVIDTQTVAHGSSATAPAEPTREGYTFNGWDKAFDNVTGDLTVTAQYEAIDYALIVKYEYSDGSEAAATYTATLNMGDEYNVASPEITGHTPDQVTVSGTMPAKDVTVTVVYTVNQYTITFNSAGGSAIVPITLDYGAVVIAPEDPTREGYTFAGWEPELPATMPAQDIEVTAQWTINKYTVTFVDWDGSVIDTQTVEHGGSATAPEVSEREGYTFNGWDKAFDNVTGDLTVTAQYEAIDYALIVKYEYSDGSEAAATYTATLNMGDEYNVASPEITGHTPDQVTVSGTMPAKDVTVTVVYTVNQYTITFNSAGGSAIVPITLDYGAVVIAPEDPTREGYTFAGWEPELPATMPAQDIEVTAQWTINKYTVTFVDWNGSVIDTQTVEHGGSATAPEVSEREGYTFNGWYKEAELTNAWNFGTDTVTAATTLYAQWTINEYTVTFKDHGGSVLGTQTVSHGSTATAPDNPTKEGYKFDGWYADEELATAFVFDTEIKADTIIYAKWTHNDLLNLKSFIDESSTRERPSYTNSIEEWDTYWGRYNTALTAAEGVYNTLKDAGTLTTENVASISTAKTNLQREVEILDAIEDFDSAWGGRENPKGLVETVYERSLVADSFQPGRLRCYYDKEDSYLYWLMSDFLQGQGYYPGTTGTGMNPGLQNVMMSENLVQMKSCGRTVDIFHPDGNRKTKSELESEGINLAFQWLASDSERFKTGKYADFAGFEVECQLVGKTSAETGGTEFTRTYTFQFVDAGIHLFEPNFRYCVEDGVVQRVFGDDNSVFNATQDIHYTNSTIQAAINAANPGDMLYVANGTFSESVKIDKSITLIGNYMAGSGSYPTVLDGSAASGSGFQIEAGVSDVTIAGFEIRNFVSGGIVAEGAGINNVTIEKNYIHDVQADGVSGSTDGTQPLSGWNVINNIIECVQRFRNQS